MKYVGSKRKISKEIIEKIQQYTIPFLENSYTDEYESWIEPFVGGANVIDKIWGFNNIVGYDNNEYLIKMWNSLQNGWVPPNHISEEEYKDIRENKEKYSPELVSWIGIPCSFGAKWFGGYARNIRERDYFQEALNSLKLQLPKLKNVKFIYSDYRDITINNKSIIYCDPPYSGTLGYSTSSNFNHEEFWNWCDNKIKEGHKVFVSEYLAPKNWKCILTIRQLTTIDSNRKESIEKLFTKD